MSARHAVAFDTRNYFGDKHMSETLAEKTCTPCRGGVPPLTRDEAHAARLRKSVEEFVFDLRFEAADAAEPTDLGGPSESVDHGDSELILKHLHTLRTKPGEDVEDDIGGVDAMSDRLGAGRLNRRQSVREHRGEDLAWNLVALNSAPCDPIRTLENWARRHPRRVAIGSSRQSQSIFTHGSEFIVGLGCGSIAQHMRSAPASIHGLRSERYDLWPAEP